MKKLFIIPLILISFSGFSQIRTLLAPKGVLIYDTTKYLHFASNYIVPLTDSTAYFDSSKVAVSIQKNATRDSFQLISGSGSVLATVKDSSGGGGGSSTVQQDSSLLTATSHSSTNLSTGYTPGRKGLLLRDSTSSGATSSPGILFQASTGVGTSQRIFAATRLLGNGKSWEYNLSLDTITYVKAFSIDYNNGQPGIYMNGGSAWTALSLVGSNITGTKLAISGLGFGCIGTTALTNSTTFQIAPYSSPNNYGIGLPQISSTLRNNNPTGVIAGSIVSGGSGYTTTLTTLTNIHSSGSGATANITATGGVVTGVAFTATRGQGYKFGDTLSASGGTGFTYVVTRLYGDNYNGNFYYDSTLSKPVWWDAHAHIDRAVVDSQTISGNLTVSSASTLTLVASQDYIFTGTTATYTLPAISTTAIGRQNRIYIKNRGSGTITLNAASGSTIYTTSAVSTINVIAGAACELTPDGTYFLVNYNQ